MLGFSLPSLAESILDQTHTRILKITGDLKYGEHLSGECTACHNNNGTDTGIPSIIGWPRASFVYALLTYKVGERENPIMRMISSRLNDEEISSLALYYEKFEQ